MVEGDRKHQALQKRELERALRAAGMSRRDAMAEVARRFNGTAMSKEK